MDTWTLQTGFPEVVVTRNYASKVVDFKQQRFTYAVDNHKKRLLDQSSDNPLWWIPISYTFESVMDFENTKPVQWIRKTPNLSISMPNLSDDDWILVNIQQTGSSRLRKRGISSSLLISLSPGYYRVNYDAKNWELLTRYLQDPSKFQNIAPANRAQLVDDAMNLARGGRLDYNVALNITKYLVHETEYVPWKSALNALTFINAMMIRTGDYDKLKVKARLCAIEFHDLFAISD